MPVSILSLYIGGELFFDETYALSSHFSKHSDRANSVILSLGSIIDEIALVAVATLERHSSISLGAILGSNSVIIAAFLVFILMSHKRRQPEQFTTVTAYTVLIGVVLLFSAYIFHLLFWVGSLLLLLIFVAYYFTGSGTTEKSEMEDTTGNFSLTVFVISVISIGISSFVTVKIIQNVSKILSVGELLSSIFIASIAGSLPEIYLMKLSFNRGRDRTASSILNSSTIYKTAILLPLSAMVVPVVEGGNEIVAIITFLMLALFQLIITRF